MKPAQTKRTLRSLAVLLAYPSPELKAHVGDIREALVDDGALPAPAILALEPLLSHIERTELLDLQAEYSDMFDRSRSLSLHLFEHVHGDSRDRGTAMIDLIEQYSAAGFYLDSTELPDFVPVFLEFTSCLEPQQACEMLAQPAHVFAALAQRLDKRESRYAAILHALTTLPGVRPDSEALEEMRQGEQAEDPAAIDSEWEEAPVTFNASAAHQMGGPTGAVAKIRAGNRPVAKEPGQ